MYQLAHDFIGPVLPTEVVRMDTGKLKEDSMSKLENKLTT